MSTTFGVKIKGDEELIEVAFRSNGMRFINPLACLLPDDTPVIPLDNTPQGVYMIGDIKVAITKTDPDAEFCRTIKINNIGK